MFARLVAEQRGTSGKTSTAIETDSGLDCFCNDSRRLTGHENLLRELADGGLPSNGMGLYEGLPHVRIEVRIWELRQCAVVSGLMESPEATKVIADAGSPGILVTGSVLNKRLQVWRRRRDNTPKVTEPCRRDQNFGAALLCLKPDLAVGLPVFGILSCVAPAEGQPPCGQADCVNLLDVITTEALPRPCIVEKLAEAKRCAECLLHSCSQTGIPQQARRQVTNGSACLPGAPLYICAMANSRS